MAADLKVPPEAIAGLQKIADLDQRTFELFAEATRTAKPTLAQKGLSTEVAQKVQGAMRRDDIVLILASIFGLYVLKYHRGASPDEITESVIDSIAELKNSNLSQEKLAVLKPRLNTLLRFDKSVAVTAKAVDVMMKHDRVFCDARILSDIRSVFTDSTAAPSAAVIVHTLRIGFHHQGEHDEVFIALDTGDLKKLKEAIVRAEEKNEALKLILQKSQLPYLEV